MKNLWNIEIEKEFFKASLTKGFATKENLFYHFGKDYLAYIPKTQENNRQTLNSRNSLIGSFTETWCENLINEMLKDTGLYAIKNVICPEIGLPKNSGADVAICTRKDQFLKPEEIIMIFEVKMSIINNYKYVSKNRIDFIGDYKTHKGNPSLLRSDSMLKAIGKSINIRVSGKESSKIPIVIIGNSPITKHYVNKVDYLKSAGVVQEFISLYPNPIDSDCITDTPGRGFKTYSNINEFHKSINKLLEQDMNYFSSMISKQALGSIILTASKQKTDIERAESFLKLIRR